MRPIPKFWIGFFCLFAFLAGLLFPGFLKKEPPPEPALPKPGILRPKNPEPDRWQKVLPLSELKLKPAELTSVNPVIRLENGSGLPFATCGNGQIDSGETFLNCPQDCGRRISSEAGIYTVNAGEMLLFSVSAGKNQGCAATNPGFKVWESSNNNSWSMSQEFLVPEPLKTNILAVYTPFTGQIKKDQNGCFLLEVFGMKKSSPNLSGEDVKTFHNAQYGFSIDLIPGCRIEEHDGAREQLSGAPALLWQAFVFHDSYGVDLQGKDMQPIIEMSVEEFPGKDLSKDPMQEKSSTIPCGVPVGEMCKKFFPCTNVYQYPFVETQGVKGILWIVKCGKSLRGMVFGKGSRLYKFMFLSESPQHRVLCTSQIEAMLRTIRFDE